MYEDVLPKVVHHFERPTIGIDFSKNEEGHIVVTSSRSAGFGDGMQHGDLLRDVRFGGTNLSEYDGLEASVQIMRELRNVSSVNSFIFYNCTVSGGIPSILKLVGMYGNSVEFEECNFEYDGIWHVLRNLMDCTNRLLIHVLFRNCCFGDLRNDDELQNIIRRMDAEGQGLHRWHSFGLFAEYDFPEERDLRDKKMMESTQRIVELLSPVLLQHALVQSTRCAKSCFKKMSMQGSDNLLERLVTPPAEVQDLLPVDILNIWGMSVESRHMDIMNATTTAFWKVNRSTPYHVALHDVSFRGFREFDSFVQRLHLLGTKKITLDLIHFDGKSEDYFAKRRCELQLSGRRLPIGNVVFRRTTKCMVEILRGVVENQHIKQLNVANGPTYASYDENRGATYDEMLGSIPDEYKEGKELCPVDTTHRCLQALLLRGLVQVPSLVLSEPFEGKQQYDRFFPHRYHLPYVDSPPPEGKVKSNEIGELVAKVDTYHDAYYLLCCLRRTSSLTRVVLFMEKCKSEYEDSRESLMKEVAISTKCVPIDTSGLLFDDTFDEEVETWAMLYDIVKNNFALSELLIYNDEYSSVELKGYRDSIAGLLRRNCIMTDGTTNYN